MRWWIQTEAIRPGTKVRRPQNSSKICLSHGMKLKQPEESPHGPAAVADEQLIQHRTVHHKQ
jgi:hypothetical protein